MNKTKFLAMAMWIVLLMPLYKVKAQELSGDELKSMEKYQNAKGKNGIVVPALKLSKEQMKWWQDAKFGMFIHWGLYAIEGRGEWAMHNYKIPAKKYAKLADKFNPRFFDADTWAHVAKKAGMKYMVLTARHHDGFALWNSPSSYRNFSSYETAAKRDFIKEYTDACRKAGLGVGIYYSPMDWRFPGYFKPRELSENAALMKKQCYGQVEELMKNYGKIDILWYDGGWLAHRGSDADAAWFWEPDKLNKMVRKYQPNAVVSPRSGWEGDFQCNEGSKKISGSIIDTPWEKCLNLNQQSWGYSPKQNLMSLKEIIVMLVNTVDRGGNMLLNVGPDAQGVIPETHIARLKEVGNWLKKYGESIYDTRPGPFEPVNDRYGSVQKDDKIYVHLLDLKDTLQLPPLEKRIVSCKQMGGKPLKFTQDENGITIWLDKLRPDPAVSTLALETR
ncbi:alpha-L-fucosidase [Muricauda sp. SCSIO 64092]|uniref:alpha-L-fucosidase n=1 Tax=Allomuricauda sp. SCSIO 64092 TaxID=2908842 RepID=UPI001FF328DF|nr:alpha-L-fucosidase [Muricauda sp. SCSIO 64092]UOY04949.1 alpha-L-fucosidase [Muricauda sp. SCSIO 64092]